MSQGRSKVLKEEAGQLKIEIYITSINTKTPKNQRQQSRSRSRKRKTPPSLEKEKDEKSKRYIPSQNSPSSQHQSYISMTSLSATTYEIKDDDPFLKAME